MRFLLVVLAVALVGCSSSSQGDGGFACEPSDPRGCGLAPDASLADVRVNEASTDAPDGGCGGQCRAGQICSYDPGCASPTKSCHTDTGGDAVALRYCACDGREFTTSELFPTQPYENAGRCMTDGGDAGDATDGG